MRKTLCNVLCFAAAAAFCAAGAAPVSVARAHTISGKIVIEGRTRCDSVIVWVDVLHMATADSAGDYAIDGVNNGEYAVMVWAPHCLAHVIDTVKILYTGVSGVNDTLIAADIVEDGRIDLRDAGELMRHYRATPDSAMWDDALDFDGNDTIDSLDVAALMRSWRSSSNLAVPVPIVVIEPDSATIWAVGSQNVTIRWNPGNAAGFVSIGIYKGYDPMHELIGEITPSTTNDGSYTEYDLPNGIAAGADYRILVMNTTSGFGGWSDYFEIRQTIAVTEPTGATVWSRRQTNVPVTWLSGGLGGSVTIKLYKGASLVFDFFDYKTPNDGAVTVNVPAGVPIGSDYRVQVYWDADHYDFSEYFAIRESGIAITAPDTNTVWLSGQANVAIRWESSFLAGSVSIGLYRDGGLVEMIAPSTPNDGEYSEYAVPLGLTAGSGYQIRISPDGGAESASAHFEIGRPSGWDWLLPSTGGYDLNAVSFVDENTGTAVGEYGAILRTTDGGAAWIRQWGSTRKTLRGVDFLDENTGIAVGDGGVILKTTDGGGTWVCKASGLRNANLYAVAYADAETIVAVGWGWPIGSSIGAQAFCRSTDGGETWASSVTYGFACPRSVSFFNARVGAAAGDCGSTFWTSDGGATWRAGGWGNALEDGSNSIVVLDESTAIVAGLDYYAGTYGWTYVGVIYRTVNAGETWSRVDWGHAAANALSFADDLNGLGVGGGGAILRTTDGGVTWTSQSSGLGSSFSGVSFVSATTGTAVGAFGRIIRTTDGGATWALQTPSTPHTLRGMSFADANAGVAVGGSGPDGIVLRTIDAGQSWSFLATAGGRLIGVSMANADTGIAVGGYAVYNEFGWKEHYTGVLLRTADGGVSWSSELPEDTILVGVSLAAPNAGMVFGTVYGQDSCVVLRTEDNGTTWTPLPTGPCFSDIWLVDANAGTGVGANGAVSRTLDGGVTWIPQTSGTTRDLLGVHFTDANTGTVVGYAGTILRTNDGGATWIPQTSGTTKDLWCVRFADASTGIAVGREGTILRTADGGTTWVRHESGTTRDLYAIYMMDAGTIIVAGAGGAILKTTTGGE